MNLGIREILLFFIIDLFDIWNNIQEEQKRVLSTAATIIKNPGQCFQE